MQLVASALYDQIILEAKRLFGPQVYHLLSSLFDDAIGRLEKSKMKIDENTPFHDSFIL